MLCVQGMLLLLNPAQAAGESCMAVAAADNRADATEEKSYVWAYVVMLFIFTFGVCLGALVATCALRRAPTRDQEAQAYIAQVPQQFYISSNRSDVIHTRRCRALRRAANSETKRLCMFCQLGD